MVPRLQLHEILTGITEHAYFQPPTTVKLIYPCILYRVDGGKTERADNKLYRYTKRYQVTVIDSNPDSDLPDKVIALPMCEFNRFYTSDNLNHHVFNLFF